MGGEAIETVNGSTCQAWVGMCIGCLVMVKTMSIEKGKRFVELVKKRERLEGTKIMGLLLNLATSQ